MRTRTLVTGVLLAVAGLPTAGQAQTEDALRALMAGANAQLAASGADVRLEVIEYITASDPIGRTVFFSNVGNKQLDHHFVPGDPRRVLWSGPLGSGDDITWASDTVQGNAGPGLAATQTAISDAMATWEAQKCSNIPLTATGAAGNFGVLSLILGFGGAFPPPADIVHAGFGGGFPAVFLPPPIIAATFTFIFVAASVPTDIDGNGKLDTAFREVYYTFNFPWGIGTDVDVETVALHEAGHGLSQAHFGKLFETDANGKFHFAPRAVMNAGYTGVQQELAGSDNGGHCSIWAKWPNN